MLEELERDPEFRALPSERRLKILHGYFDSELADDEFFQLPIERQNQIRARFLEHEGWVEEPETQASISTGPQPGVLSTLKESGKSVLQGLAGDPARLMRGSIQYRKPEQEVDIIPGMGFEYMSPVQQAQTGRRIAEAGGAEHAPGIIQEELAKQKEESTKILTGFINALPALDPKVTPKDTIPRMAHNAAVGLSRFLPSIGLTFVSPATAPAMIYAQLVGMDYDDRIAQGEDPERAWEIAIIKSIPETAVEFSGTLFQVGMIKNLAKSMGVAGKNSRKLTRFLRTVTGSIGTEAFEEGVQAYIDAAADTWAKHRLKPPKEISNKYFEYIQSPEFISERNERTATGGMGGAMLAVPGGAVSLAVGKDQPKVSKKTTEQVLEEGIASGEMPIDHLLTLKEQVSPESEEGRAIDNVLKKHGDIKLDDKYWEHEQRKIEQQFKLRKSRSYQRQVENQMAMDRIMAETTQKDVDKFLESRPKDVAQKVTDAQRAEDIKEKGAFEEGVSHPVETPKRRVRDKAEVEELAGKITDEQLEKGIEHAEEIRAKAEEPGPEEGVERREQEPVRVRDVKKDRLEAEKGEVEPEPEAVEAHKIGDSVSVSGIDAIVAKTERIDGVDYELYNANKLKDKRGVVRVFDADSGNMISVTTYPTYDQAETEYEKAVGAVEPPPSPARAEVATTGEGVEKQPSDFDKYKAKKAKKVVQKVKATVEETGEVIELERDANEALETANNELEKYNGLLECLKS